MKADEVLEYCEMSDGSRMSACKGHPISRSKLAARLKTEFEHIKATCDLHNICIKCFEPIPNHTTICHCDHEVEF